MGVQIKTDGSLSIIGFAKIVLNYQNWEQKRRLVILCVRKKHIWRHFWFAKIFCLTCGAVIFEL
jgi:hypothetical protein